MSECETNNPTPATAVIGFRVSACRNNAPNRFFWRLPNIIFGSLQKKRFGALFLHADTLNPITAVAGVGLFVSHSDMDYRSFSATRFINMTTQRKQLQRNGSSRRRAWEFLYVDANPFRASHVELNVEGGPLS